MDDHKRSSRLKPLLPSRRHLAFCRHKKPPFGGLIYLYKSMWYPGRDLNPHSHKPKDFKSLVSTDFTTRAQGNGSASRSRTGLNGFAIRHITALLTRLNSVYLFRLESEIPTLSNLERETMLELATPTLAGSCSTN